MKRTLLLIVACVFAIASAHAQSYEVEATTQLTKAEQFKMKNSFIKETTIYEDKKSGMKLYAKLFTDLKSGDQLVALEFWPTFMGQKALAAIGVKAPLGYLDMDKVDDLLLALDTILNEHNNAAKSDSFTITYTAPGGIDLFFTTELTTSAFGGPGTIIFRKKWFKSNEYGEQTAVYSESTTMCSIANLPKLISCIKEAQTIAKQSLGK